jgi:hypothetical protein
MEWFAGTNLLQCASSNCGRFLRENFREREKMQNLISCCYRTYSRYIEPMLFVPQIDEQLNFYPSNCNLLLCCNSLGLNCRPQGLAVACMADSDALVEPNPVHGCLLPLITCFKTHRYLVQWWVRLFGVSCRSAVGNYQQHCHVMVDLLW